MTDSWNAEQMSRLRTSVLRRSVRRFRVALRHLGDRKTAPVERLRRGLRAMKRELARRGSQEAPRPSAERGDGAASRPARAPRSHASRSHASRSHASAARSASRSSQAAAGGGGEEDTPLPPSAEGGDDETPAPSMSEPIWRLIPHLSGTSSKVVAVLSGEGVVRHQSAPIKWLLGFDAEEFIGKPLRAFLCDGSRERAREAIARMARAEEKFDCWRLEFQTASGGSLWLEGMASNFLRDPRLGGILVYWRELAG
jgi:hypothetical protein